MAALSSVIYDVQGYFGGHINFKQIKREGNMEESYVKRFYGPARPRRDADFVRSYFITIVLHIYIFVGHGKWDSVYAASTKGKSMLWKQMIIFAIYPVITSTMYIYFIVLIVTSVQILG